MHSKISSSIISFIFILFILSGCISKEKQLNKGIWKAEIERKDGNHIIFNFEVKDSLGKKIIYIINAEERLMMDDITIKNDSVFIKMPFFDSWLELNILTNGNLEGMWRQQLEDSIRSIPLRAFHGTSERFKVSDKKVSHDISGRWEVKFYQHDSDTTFSIGEFQQDGSIVTGTFVNPKGDYRYLQGVLDGDQLKLSCFDGAHAYLFTAQLSKDGGLINGRFYSGPTYIENWTAVKNDQAELGDEYGLTRMKKGETTLDFSFKSIDGEEVSINDERFKDKIVVVQLMGSWCPNCMDETRFLSDYYSKHKNEGIEIVGLAYERTSDNDKAASNLQSFKKRFNVEYPMLITGVSPSDNMRTEKTLPQLESIIAFPTTIFLDKNGKVYKIHTGFRGPGTGHHYEQFKNDFEKLIGELKAAK